MEIQGPRTDVNPRANQRANPRAKNRLQSLHHDLCFKSRLVFSNSGRRWSSHAAPLRRTHCQKASMHAKQPWKPKCVSFLGFFDFCSLLWSSSCPHNSCLHRSLWRCLGHVALDVFQLHLQALMGHSVIMLSPCSCPRLELLNHLLFSFRCETPPAGAASVLGQCTAVLACSGRASDMVRILVLLARGANPASTKSELTPRPPMLVDKIGPR